MDSYYKSIEYQSKRVNEYPKEWKDQLELLWKDIDNGIFGENAKNSEWYKLIKQIRERHPKPTQG